MKRSALLSLLPVAALAQVDSSSTTSTAVVTLTFVPIATLSTTTSTSPATPTVSPVLTSTSTSTSTSASTSTGVDGIVTVLATRTFTNFCGCGIPGVSTVSVNPTLISTSSTTSSSSSSSTSSSSSSTTSSTTISQATTSQATSTGATLIPSDTITTSITTTTTGGNAVSATLTSTTSSTTSSTSSISSTSTSSSSSSSTTSVTSAATTATTSAASTTTTTAGPVVTDEAYIDTVLRHHNVHRANHSANALTWSPSLAATAQKIAQSCNYAHNTSVDGGGYGQNIGAGYPSNMMGNFITEGLYNSEVNSYTYYGGEPDTSTVGQWGHFSQIVWKGTTTVGCYTQDCSAQGLQNAGGASPFFVVCNYSPAGNVVGSFGANVGAPLGAATVHADYECPSVVNCVGPTA